MYQALELITDSGSFSLAVLVNERGDYETPSLTMLSNVTLTGKQEVWDNPDFIYDVFYHYLMNEDLPKDKDRYTSRDTYLVKEILDNIKLGEILELKEIFKRVIENGCFKDEIEKENSLKGEEKWKSVILGRLLY